MDFFEVLERNVRKGFGGNRCLYWSQERISGREAGINATIEALKEMMVGEPRVWFITTPGRVSLKTAEFVGSDGEEVVVMVFRTPKESE